MVLTETVTIYELCDWLGKEAMRILRAVDVGDTDQQREHERAFGLITNEIVRRAMLSIYDPKHRYGKWAGNPKGQEQDPVRCVVEVWQANDCKSRQCKRRRGHGQNGLFCKQHANLGSA